MSTTSNDKPQAPVSAGRGLLYISAAKFWFMIAGYAIQFALPRAFGSPAKYGAWVVVLACVSLFNNVVVTGTIQAVSRFVAQIPGRRGVIVRAALRRQVIGAVLVAGIFIGGAPLFARYVLHDPAYTSYLQVAGIVTFCYALYAVFVGSANGQQLFQKQAGLDIGFATLRAAFVIGAAALTHSVLASLSAFAAAAAIILVVSVLWVGVGPSDGEAFDRAELEQYFHRVSGYLVLVNLLMFIDGLMLKPLVTIASSSAAAGDTQAGLYGAVQTIARLPYQLLLAVTFVIFPMISRATFDADVERARRYVVATMRYSLLVLVLMAVALAARPTAVMRLLFPADYAVAAPALPILLLGYTSFSLFNILGTILNAAGDTAASLRTGTIAVVVCAAAVYGALSYALPHGVDPSLAAAIATAFAMTVGLVLAGWAVRQRFGGVMPMATVIRVLVASAAAILVGRLWPTSGFFGGKIGTLASLVVIAGAYLAVAAPELRPSELRKLRAATRG